MIGQAYCTAYCASKHAMVGMTRAIALEIARSEVTINCVCPGWVETRMTEETLARIEEAAQRQMDLDCLGPQGYADLERARATQPRIVVAPPRQPVYPPPVPQKPYLTHCGNFHCVDNTGARYPRAGPGRFPGNDGVCRSKGGQAPC